MVDHDGATGRQSDTAREGGFDLVFDLEAGEQRHRVLVQLHAANVVGHHVAHELAGLLVDFLGIDKDFTDIRLEVVANSADDQATFLQDQERCGLGAGSAVNGAPQLQQVVQIPLQFFQIAADTGGAGDQAHAGRYFQLCQQVFQLLTLFALDAARHATTTRVVRHQHHVTTGQADVGGQSSALVAALVLLHLHHHFHAFTQHILNARTAAIEVLEIGTGNFLERQETVTFGTVIDKAGFQRRLDAGDRALVDIALALLLAYGLDVEIDELLPINNGDAQLFGLRRIEQHAFH